MKKTTPDETIIINHMAIVLGLLSSTTLTFIVIGNYLYAIMKFKKKKKKTNMKKEIKNKRQKQSRLLVLVIIYSHWRDASTLHSLQMEV